MTLPDPERPITTWTLEEMDGAIHALSVCLGVGEEDALELLADLMREELKEEAMKN